MECKPIVTLIGVSQAVVGKEFIHKGPGSKCESCRYAQVCVGNLEPERIYKVVRVRDKTLPCDLHEAEMQVVEVVESEITASVPSKQAIERAIVTFHTAECKVQNCENYRFCFPMGLKDGDRCEIVTITGSLQCPQGPPLLKALLRRVQAS